jgi:hypothetical protein
MILNTKIDLAVQLSNIFHIGFNFITAANTPKPSWKTNRKYKLTRGEWVKHYTDEITLLGVGFGQNTKYCMLDIDRDSKYHPYKDLKAFKKVCQSLEKVGLVSHDIIRSSESQGIHVYFHLPSEVNTFRLAALIHVTLINAGIDLRAGQVEQFPNPKDYGHKDHPTYYKPHRLPLQPNAGGMLLDQNGEILLTAENLTHESMLTGFLRRAEASAAEQDIELLERKLNWAYAKYKTEIRKYQHHSRKQYSQIAQEWKENLEFSLEIGWTGKHQTNTLLPIYIQYGIVFLGLKEEALANWMYEKVTSTRGYREHCRHQHEIKKVITNWVNNTERQDYYIEYCGFPARSGLSPYKVAKHIKSTRNEHNENLIERTKQRLNEILTALTEIPSKIGDRVAAIQTKSKELFGQGISRNTLYKSKYKSIWDKDDINPNPTVNPTATANPTVIEDNLAKNTTPPSISSQADIHSQTQPINPIKIDRKLKAQTHTQTALSYTPPIYETFVDKELTYQLHQYLQLYCINLICGSILVLQAQIYLAIISVTSDFRLKSLFVNLDSFQEHLPNLEVIQSQSVPSALNLDLEILPSKNINITENSTLLIKPGIESESAVGLTAEEIDSADFSLNPISIGTRLRRNVERVGKKTYSALRDCEVVSLNGLDWVVRDPDGCRWNVSHHALASGVWEVEDESGLSVMPVIRSVVMIACDVRKQLVNIPDELLLELLHHPERETIDWLIELAGKVVAAESGEVVTAFTAMLSSEQKSELWGVLNDDERIAVRQKIDRLLSTAVLDSVDPSLGESGAVATVSVADLQHEMPLGTGSIVRTVTGLVGVIRYIFDSISKPFVVYHEQLQRTIRYESGDLLF